jgi:hypothetical protein
VADAVAGTDPGRHRRNPTLRHRSPGGTSTRGAPNRLGQLPLAACEVERRPSPSVADNKRGDFPTNSAYLFTLTSVGAAEVRGENGIERNDLVDGGSIEHQRLRESNQLPDAVPGGGQARFGEG